MKPASPYIWQFCLLGGLTIIHNGVTIAPPPDRAQSLLAALLLNLRPLSRLYLCGLLFPDDSEKEGRKRLSDHLWLLRKALPDLPLESAEGRLHLPARLCWLDVTDFREACALDDPAAWQYGLDLYSGDLLPAIYDDWLLVERENLLISYVNLSNRLINWHFDNHTHIEAIPKLEKLLQIEPLNEDSVMKLMQAHAMQGNRGAALRVFDRFKAQCSQEGLQPDSALASYSTSLRLAFQPIETQIAPDRTVVEPASLLQVAQEALKRGHVWRVHSLLEEMRKENQRYDSFEISLLEVDLVLKFGAPAQAEKLLVKLDSHLPPVKLRLAQLASENDDPGVAVELATELLTHLPGEQYENMRMQALLALARAQMRLGETSQAMMSAEKVISLAAQCALPEMVLRAQIVQGRILIRQGYLERALAMLQIAYQLADELNLPFQAAATLHDMVHIHYLTGSLMQAMDCTQQELEMWRDLGAQAQEIAALQMLSTLYSQFGQRRNAIQALEDAQEILDQLGDHIRAARNLYHLAATIAYQESPDLLHAITIARQALRIFEDCQQTGWQAAVLQTLAYCYWLQGDYSKALLNYETAYELHNRLNEMAILPEILAYQALALLGLGEKEPALQRSRQALLQLASLTLDNDLVSEIYFAHAEVLLALEDKTGALEYFSLAYHNLIKYARPLRDETARQAFFERDPTMRRLVERVYAFGLAEPPEKGVVARRLPARVHHGAAKIDVHFTLDAGPADQALKAAQGPIALRRARLKRLRLEAHQQGAKPSTQELASLLGVSVRTVKRDLANLRKAEHRG